MRRLGLLTLLVASACFNPEDPDATGTDSGGSSSSGSTDPTSASMTTNGTTSSGTSDGPTSSPTSADSTDGETTEGTSSSTTTTGTPACGGAEVCVEAAPEGWDGPGIRVTNDSGPLPGCGMAYPIQGASGYTGAMAPPAQCECSCEFPQDLVCPDASIIYYSGDMCEQGEGSNTIEDGTCDTFFIGQGINSVTAHANPPDDVQCQSSLDETLPPVMPTDPTTVCAPESLGDSCGDASTCLPAAEMNTYCISQDGDVPCPADSAYDNRTVVYSDFTDSRECGGCGCGGAEVECTGFIRAYNGSGCTGAFITVPIDDSCVESIDDGINDARYFAGTATGGCPPVGGMPDGEVTPTEPTTLCCADF